MFSNFKAVVTALGVGRLARGMEGWSKNRKKGEGTHGHEHQYGDAGCGAERGGGWRWQRVQWE